MLLIIMQNVFNALHSFKYQIHCMLVFGAGSEVEKPDQSGLRASSFMLWTNCIVKLNAGNLNQRRKKILLETGGVS